MSINNNIHITSDRDFLLPESLEETSPNVLNEIDAILLDARFNVETAIVATEGRDPAAIIAASNADFLLNLAKSNLDEQRDSMPMSIVGEYMDAMASTKKVLDLLRPRLDELKEIYAKVASYFMSVSFAFEGDRTIPRPSRDIENLVDFDNIEDYRFDPFPLAKRSRRNLERSLVNARSALSYANMSQDRNLIDRAWTRVQDVTREFNR